MLIHPHDPRVPLLRHESILAAIEKKKALVSDYLSYRPTPEPMGLKSHLGRLIGQLQQEIAELEEEDRKLILQAEQRRLFLNPAEDNRDPLTANYLARDRGLISTASPAVNQGTSVGRRQRRPPDPRKELIARLKARNPNAKARRICELIDQTLEKVAPIRRDNLSPLQSWGKKAPRERTWVGLYDSNETRNSVRGYVNKVPALEISK